MTLMIESQIVTMVVMLYCGMASAIVYDVFSLFINRFLNSKKILRIFVKLMSYVVIAIVISEFVMFCQNGKLTFYSIIFLAFGLFLWRKIFYDKINPR